MEKNFWELIYNMHLYDTKGEALFKAFLITISWVGGVNMVTLPDNITITLAASLFLFSAALIMEYAVKLVVTEKIVARILPLVIVGVSGICVIATFGMLVDKPLKLDLQDVYNMTIFPQWVIWFDVVVQLMINKPSDKKIETILKEVG